MSLLRLPYQNRILRQSAVGSAILQSIQLATLEIDGLRTRLRKMSDEELRKFGKPARYIVSPTANMGKPPLPDFVLQLEEARAEWRRRQRSVDLAAALTDNPAQGVIAKMAKSYRLISGDAVEVNRQLAVLSAENREGSPHAPQ